MANAKMLANARKTIEEKLAERGKKHRDQKMKVEQARQEFAKLNSDGADAEVRIAAKDNLQRQEDLLKEFEADIAGWQNKLTELEADEKRELHSRDHDNAKRAKEVFEAEVMSLRPDLPSFIAALDVARTIGSRIDAVNASRPDGHALLVNPHLPGQPPQEETILKVEQKAIWCWPSGAPAIGMNIKASPGLPGYGYMVPREGKPTKDTNLYEFVARNSITETYLPAERGEAGKLISKWLADTIKGAVDCDTPEARRAFLEQRIGAMKTPRPAPQRLAQTRTKVIETETPPAEMVDQGPMEVGGPSVTSGSGAMPSGPISSGQAKASQPASRGPRLFGLSR